MTLSPAARAAPMMTRWAWDLEGGGVMVPRKSPGVIVMFMKAPPYSRESSSCFFIFTASALPISLRAMNEMSAPSLFLSLVRVLS